ncbi:MAG: MBL fold metallo-hydrolase [Angelakisella sp.]|nr:MBL fold metallo-hydrolase [Angelakisella sp.]
MSYLKRIISFATCIACIVSLMLCGTTTALAAETATPDKPIMLDNGLQVRWFNNAGFEMILPSGKHLLVDPWLDSSNTFAFSVEQVEQYDYVLLSHIHSDHAGDIKALENKFSRFVLMVGDFDVDPLCEWQDLDLRNVYRVRDGAKYSFDDVTVEVFGSRHTEAPQPALRSKSYKEDSENANSGWWGNFEVLNYLITTSDGTKVLVWAGMTTEDQKNLFKDLHPDIAFMHLSPKSDAKIFAQMVASWGPKLVVPHHYDAIKAGVEQKPDQIDRNLSKEYQELFLKYDANKVASFDEAAYVNYFGDEITRQCPTAQILQMEHHKWYRFSTAYAVVD